jgi:hypothetical protein
MIGSDETISNATGNLLAIGWRRGTAARKAWGPEVRM